MRKPKLAIFVDHDIILRNFVLNNALEDLNKEFELTYVLPNNSPRVTLDLDTLDLPEVKTISVVSSRVSILRRLGQVTALYKMHGLPAYESAARKRFYRNALGIINYKINSLLSSKLFFPSYKRLILTLLGSNRKLDKFLISNEYHAVIHPTVLDGPWVTDLVSSGKKLGIPLVFVMNSWDNPATKAVVYDFSDRLVVWGEQTKLHAIRHLGWPEEKILKFGAAQFEIYKSLPDADVEDLRTDLGIRNQEKVLLYAGSSKGVDEVSHLLIIENAIANNYLQNTVVIYRPHPWRVFPPQEQFFFDIKWHYVRIDPSAVEGYVSSFKFAENHPDLKGNLFGLAVTGGAAATEARPDLARYSDLHSLLTAVDAVISPLSTLLLEAALLGKPIAAYTPDESVSQDNYLRTSANMVHFSEFFDKVNCMKCESGDALIETCKMLIDKSYDAKFSEQIKSQCEWFVEPTQKPFCGLLGEELKKILRIA